MMKLIGLLLLAPGFTLSAQNRPVVLLRSAANVAPQLTVTLSSLAAGTTVNLSAANTGWIFNGEVAGKDYTGQPWDCQPTLNNQTVNSCNPGAYKLGGSGITPLYVSNTPERVYSSYGANLPNISWAWKDSAGPNASGSSSRMFQVVSGGYTQMVAFEADPVVKTATVYVTSWNAGTSCGSGAGVFHVTFHFTDGSNADQTKTITATQADCSGVVKLVATYASATSSYMTVSVDRGTTELGTSLIAASLSDAAVTGATRAVSQTIEIFGALFAAARGETLAFADGYTYDGHLTLPPKPDVLDPSGNPLWVTAKWARLPYVSGVRVALSDRANMPTLTSHDTDPVFVQPKGSNHYAFDGFNFASNNPNANGLIYALIVVTPPLTVFGTHASLLASQTIADLPVGLSLLHCIVHGRDGVGAVQFNQTRGIVADGVDVTIQDSVVDNWHYNGVETNAILVQVGKNVRIVNSEVASNGEAIMIHNAAAYDDAQAGLVSLAGGGLYADGTIVQHCFVHKLYPEWINDGLVKNLIENKTGKNTHITGNLLENSFEGTFSDGQHGIGIAIQSRNAAHKAGEYPNDGDTNGHPWAVTKNIEVDNNIIRHVGACFGTVGVFDDSWGSDKLAPLLAAGKTGRNSNVNIHDNHCEDVSGSLYTTYSGSLPAINPAYPGFGMRAAGPDHFHFQHNTVIFREQSVGQVMPAGTQQGVRYNSYKVPDTGNGSNAAAFIPNIPSAAGQGNGAVFAGVSFLDQLWDSNIFTFGIACDSDDGGAGCFRDAANQTFTNNTFTYDNLGTTRAAGLASLNSTYPGQYTGNLFNSKNVTGRGAPTAALFAQECSIRTGNHPGISCTNPAPPTF